ncbi:GTP-binding protein [Actinoplanes sp. NPDC023714]|uniref:CobW family GTP-binding protein n=1 Tax=Actinoplanes sp. NPDC023714 TaxID=3154322 RepID=UPI0033E7DCF4
MPTSTDLRFCGFWPHATAETAGRHPVLPETGEPDELRRTVPPETGEPDDLRGTGRPAPAVVTVVPADLLLDGLTDERRLREVGLHRDEDDERSIGDLVARQIEQADAVVLTGDLEDAWETEQLRTLLRRLAPWAHHPRPGDVPAAARGRAEPVDAVGRGLRGYAVGVHEPVPSHGVSACVFRARRPFHPGRLHDALDEVTAGVLRSRGHFWLASRPDLVMTWESAGTLSIGPHSGWLAELPREHWDEVDVERRLAADLDWDPYYGDRHHQLSFTGIDIDPVRLHRTLAGCLLTDDELSRGEEHWRRLPDPFRRAYPAPAVTEA